MLNKLIKHPLFDRASGFVLALLLVWFVQGWIIPMIDRAEYFTIEAQYDANGEMKPESYVYRVVGGHRAQIGTVEMKADLEPGVDNVSLSYVFRGKRKQLSPTVLGKIFEQMGLNAQGKL